jgi:hypothetical protein
MAQAETDIFLKEMLLRNKDGILQMVLHHP